MRDIHALSIRDRSIQRCFCDNIMTKAYSKSYISDNSASLKEKGYTYAINKMTQHLRYHYHKYGTNGGILQFDFKSYFASIPHKEAKQRLKKYIKDESLVLLGEKFIDEFKELHNQKSKDKGVGLGSQVSQNIALEYANPIDHIIKDKYSILGYGRYMDDGYIISDSMERLKELKEILYQLAEENNIEVSDKKVKITPFKHHSFTFLKIRFSLTDSGKIIKKLNRNSIKAIRRKLRLFKKWCDEEKFSIEDVCTSYQSWRGHALHYNSYKTVRSMDKLFVDLFSKELGERSKPYKCTLKYIWNDEVGWIYYSSKKELQDKLSSLDCSRQERLSNGFIPLVQRGDWIQNNKSDKAKIFSNLRKCMNE